MRIRFECPKCGILSLIEEIVVNATIATPVLFIEEDGWIDDYGEGSVPDGDLEWLREHKMLEETLT